jgi:DNA-binding transcriptional ArsR family regulator
MMGSSLHEELARLLRPPRRREIWRRFLVADQPLCAVDLADEVEGTSLANVSYHVRILHSGDALEFVERERRGGGYAYFYEVRDDPYDRELVLEAIEAMGVDGE